MVSITILYPKHEGSWFDDDYYFNKHKPMAIERLGKIAMSKIFSWEFKLELTNAHDKVAGSTAHAHQPGNFSLPLIKSQKDPSGQRPGCCQVPEAKRGVSFLPTVRFPQRAGHGYGIFHVQLFAKRDFSGHGAAEPIDDVASQIFWILG